MALLIALLLTLALASDGARMYHSVALADLARTKWTHVEVCGKVTLVKHEADGDVHIRLSAGRAFVVGEIIPLITLPAPTKGQTICVRGISRKDADHGWYEIHPIEAWAVAR